MNVRIKDLPINDRPKERLVNLGVSSLSNDELLSILFNTGTKSISVKDISLSLLKYIGSISNLKDITLKELVSIKGVGVSKAVTILSALELGRRVYQSEDVKVSTKLNSPKIIFDSYVNKVKDLKQEVFYALYLDSSKKLIEDKLLFKGTVNASMVHPRDVFKYACIYSASSIICIHNHPSGNVLPSKEDINSTSNLVKLGKLFNIPVEDHIIIGKDKYYSFYENNIIK